VDVPLVAGTIATVVFAVSNLPMLRKALRTRDVSSYSLPSMIMINGANVVYSMYVFTLPLGPIWGLHTFYVVSCAIMLVLCVRQRRAGSAPDSLADTDTATGTQTVTVDVAPSATPLRPWEEPRSPARR
jgi:uncharacterized protein with PQ loop repeat